MTHDTHVGGKKQSVLRDTVLMLTGLASRPIAVVVTAAAILRATEFFSLVLTLSGNTPAAPTDNNPCKAQQRQSPLTRRPNFLGSILLSYPRASVAGEKNVHGLEVSVPGLVLVEMGQPAGHVFDQAAFPLHTRIIQRTTAPRTR